jgi:predicted hydrocarbon binding protein
MANRELDSAVANQVHTDYASGSVVAADPFTQTISRIGIVDPSFLRALIQALQLAHRTGDRGESDTQFYELGLTWGYQFHEVLESRIKAAQLETVREAEDFLKEEFIEDLNSYFSYAGTGQFRITEGNKFYLIELKNSVFQSLDQAETNGMIAVMAGFFAGLFSRLAHKTLACTVLADDRETQSARYALSNETIVNEIRAALQSGQDEKAILTAYRNQHMI